jgi:hypothetical protein
MNNCRVERSAGLELDDQNYADAFHPHGEALGPRARSCTGREKNAFGGAHPQIPSENPNMNTDADAGVRMDAGANVHVHVLVLVHVLVC